MTSFDPSLILLQEPARQSLPLVVAVPHAGRDYGPRFTQGLCLHGLLQRLTEDAYADELAAGASELGAPLLQALFPRIWLDVNRDERELDPLLIDGPLPVDALFASHNVRSGLGVVPRLLTGGLSIYAKRLPISEVEARLDAAWRPYHAVLRGLIESTRHDFGTCLLIDCHTMPTGKEAEPYDIVLGDGFGTSCDTFLVALAEEMFTRHGYRVSRNQPYAGGFTTRHYGRPANHVHALQIEIRRGLYMDETNCERGPGLQTLAAQLGDLFKTLGDSLKPLIPPMSR